MKNGDKTFYFGVDFLKENWYKTKRTFVGPSSTPVSKQFTVQYFTGFCHFFSFFWIENQLKFKKVQWLAFSPVNFDDFFLETFYDFLCFIYVLNAAKVRQKW